ENEEYDEKRHTSYISFYVDGERYIFHDQYGGNDPEMASLDPGILFAITAYKADSEVGLSLYFSLEGDNPEFDFGACYNEAGDRYETETPGFIDSMEADFVNGSVHGTFFGEMESEDGDIVEITDGEFHFNHEFNCPEVTIESPGEGDVISGLITISGTWYDESELSHIWVSVDSRGTGETVDEGLATIGSYT
ncbi:MAG TPA: hypothetical protein DDZ55_08930, partial [Firmicutes bacterium]|nr:hypothetical protein [Bacillota bacterium]